MNTIKKDAMLRMYYTLLCIASMSCCSLFSTYYSQFLQDQFLNEHIFSNKRCGIFIDIGAHDGVTLSNTYFFEKELGWTGICIEPLDDIFNTLQHNRSCICIHGCAAPKNGTVDFIEVSTGNGIEMLSGMHDTYDPRHKWRLEYEIQQAHASYKIVKKNAYNLNDILETYNLYTIDYLSLDTEGGELDILKTIDFSRFNIYIIDVENNYHSPDIQNFLASKGFKLIHSIGVDEIFINTHFF